MAAGAIGAIVWIDGEAEAAGFANLETHEPMTPQRRTRVGLATAGFTAALAGLVTAQRFIKKDSGEDEDDEDGNDVDDDTESVVPPA